MKLHSLLILCTLNALSACQTHIPNLAIDPSFSYQAKIKSGIVIGGLIPARCLTKKWVQSGIPLASSLRGTTCSMRSLLC